MRHLVIKRNLKRSQVTHSLDIDLRQRKILSMIFMLVGLAMPAAAVESWLYDASLPINSTVMVIFGALILIGGFIIFITELFESWISHSQSALVGGLRAG